MANEVLIIVKADVKTKAAYEQAERDSRLAGDKAAAAYTSAFDQRMRKLSQTISGTVKQAGQKIGEDLGSKTGEQLERKVTESVRRTQARAKADAEMTGRGIGQEMGDRAGEEVTSRITDRVGRGALYASASRSSGETIGQEMGNRASERVTERVRDSVRGTLYVSAARSSGEMIGREMGDRVHERLTSRIRDAVKRRVKVNVDTDMDVDSGLLGGRSAGLAERFAGVGDDAARSFGDRFTTGLSGFFNSSMLGQVLTVGGITIGGIISPAIIGAVGGALTSGILALVGGGILSAGIAGALKDPVFRGNDPKHPFKTGAIADLKKQYNDLLAAFGRPFRAPLADFLEKLSGFLGSRQVKDIGKMLADTFAPVAGDLGTGLIGMLQNALPGIADAAKAAAPLFETLAKHLPDIGQRLGDFFRDLSESGPDAVQFFSDFLTIIEKTIGLLGKLISGMARLYTTVRRVVTNAIAAWHDFTDATGRALDGAKEVFLRFALWLMDHVFAQILIGASEALGWIPGIGPKLKAAEGKFNQFRKNVNNELSKIHDKNVTIRIRQVFTTVGQIIGDVASQIAGRASGGVIGGAASGRVAGGLMWVGERGPELAQLPGGSRVWSHGDSARMANAGGDSGPLTLVADLDPSLEGTLIAALFKALRFTIQRQGGNVQRVLGTAY